MSLPSVTLQNLQEGLFGFFCITAVLGALYMLFTKNLLHGAYALLLSFISVAAIFVFGGADFVAVSQLMVYAGGILVLLLFGIMLTYAPRGQSYRFINQLVSSHQNLFWGLLVAACVFAGLSWLIFQTHIEISATETPRTTVPVIGKSLLTDNLFVFELVGVLLLVALIGAAHIAKQASEEK